MNQLIASHASRIGNAAGNSKYIFPLIKPLLHGDQRPALFPSLHHQDPIRQSADDAVPNRKILCRRRLSQPVLTDDASKTDSLLVKMVMLPGITDIDAAAQYAIGISSALQGPLLPGAVNAVGQTADNLHSALSQLTSETAGNLKAVPGSRPGTNDGKSRTVIIRKPSLHRQPQRQPLCTSESLRILLIQNGNKPYSPVRQTMILFCRFLKFPLLLLQSFCFISLKNSPCLPHFSFYIIYFLIAFCDGTHPAYGNRPQKRDSG